MRGDIVTIGSSCGIHGCQRITVTYKGGGNMVATHDLINDKEPIVDVEMRNKPVSVAVDALNPQIGAYVATLATTVETNRIKILGRVETLSPTASFAQNSLITVALETYINTAPIVGVPNHIVTHDNEIVTHNGEVVTYGSNSLSTWVRIAGQ